MDVFAAGCVIAEVFLDGDALFDQPQLLAYRAGSYDPSPTIAKIADVRVQVRALRDRRCCRDAAVVSVLLRWSTSPPRR
jgi:hypothetical protein